MSFVVSEGAIKSLARPAVAASYSLQLADDYTQDYAAIWRTQPAVQTCVAFLARNIASLGLHTFRRVSDTDRVRVLDHPFAQLLSKPNPRTTRYRMLNALVQDLGIYDTAYWLKINADGQPGLVRLPPSMVTPKGSWLWPEEFEFRGGKGRATFPADRVVHFHGYDPEGRNGSSPIGALRQVLAEEHEAGRAREQTLRNGARMSGYIERPADAPKWETAHLDRFKAAWRSQYSGGGSEAGGTPVLEDGMTFNAISQTAEQLQYVEARKLTREEVASKYFIPPPMVGILEHATFSNITEQHKMLYQDTLGPWLAMLTEELTLQLLPDLDTGGDVYVEFNLAEKLRGSFEEQAASLQTSVGAPWLTRNEARARVNLPRLDGGDDLVVPLNVLVGGQASPTDSGAQNSTGALAGAPRLVKARAPETHEDKHTQVLAGFFARQAQAIRSRLGAGVEAWWDTDRWDTELAGTLTALHLATATAAGKATLEALGFTADDYDQDRTLAFLTRAAQLDAEPINATTRSDVERAFTDDSDPDTEPLERVGNVFTVAASSRAAQIATTTVSFASGFGTVEAARQQSPEATKTWRTRSANPRPAHKRLDGETVPLGEEFSNGLQWPGARGGDVDDTAGCKCSVELNIP